MLKVSTWIYQVNQYIDLVQLNNPGLPLAESTKVSVASTFLSGTAATWRYMKTQQPESPGTLDTLFAALRVEFIPADHVRRTRDKLNRLRQTRSVAAYLNEFRSIVLKLPQMSEEDKWDKFLNGLKYPIRLEVLKSGAASLDGAATVALNVDSAMFAEQRYQNRGSFEQGPTPMEIGNMEQRRPESRGWNRGRSMNDQERKQREIDIVNNACFIWHKPKCRPWFHNDKKRSDIRTNNTEVDLEGDNSEN